MFSERSFECRTHLSITTRQGVLFVRILGILAISLRCYLFTALLEGAEKEEEEEVSGPVTTVFVGNVGKMAAQVFVLHGGDLISA